LADETPTTEAGGIRLRLTDLLLIGALGFMGYQLATQPDAPQPVNPVVVSTGNYPINVVQLMSQSQPDAALLKKDSYVYAEWFLTGADQLSQSVPAKIPMTTQNVAEWIDRSLTLSVRNGNPLGRYPLLTEAFAQQAATILRDPTDPATFNPLQAVGKPLTDEKRLKLADLMRFIGQQIKGLSK
jgi:hypothetical protein